MTFMSQIVEIASAANNRLAEALQNQVTADAEVDESLVAQRQVMTALRAVEPEHTESIRGQALEDRSQGLLVEEDVEPETE